MKFFCLTVLIRLIALKGSLIFGLTDFSSHDLALRPQKRYKQLKPGMHQMAGEEIP